MSDEKPISNFTAKQKRDSRRPWLVFYLGDFVQETRIIGNLARGALICLMDEYWRSGKLPSDDRLLARIADCTPQEWKRLRPDLESFFLPNFSGHQYLDKCLVTASEIKKKRTEAATSRWKKKNNFKVIPGGKADA